MANAEHLDMLRQGVDAWNAWRRAQPSTAPDLCEADLSGANLIRANLNNADLSGARLTGATLSWALLRDANLSVSGLWAVNLSCAAMPARTSAEPISTRRPLPGRTCATPTCAARTWAN